jgi:hypothetical protein
VLVRYRRFQISKILDNPCESLAVEPEVCFAWFHPRFSSILPELLGRKRTEAIDHIARARNGAGTAANQADEFANIGSRSPDFPGLPSIKNPFDVRTTDEQCSHDVSSSSRRCRPLTRPAGSSAHAGHPPRLEKDLQLLKVDAAIE